ncbi:ABC transporter permease [Campylobacter sp. MIT 12-5580]|uniref:amino acid ABC transporter permease n=1 Tax=Campylobacter sp. MIT 12-5580 TaxID=2040651 RepID=UPI0010F8516B|nr:amino acid ABC transporter permease [Campylobacter sp. MIT 12-5580]TKX30351.1 ABC transporter permease [Campylobacter sp. MIT 12-5580]
MFDFDYFLASAARIYPGIYYTIFIAALSFVLDLFFGLILALIRLYKIRLLNEIAIVYISFFRGTPLLVQLFVFYFGLPASFGSDFFGQIDAIYYALVVFSLYASAYLAEIMRSAILSVDKGQLEAAYSLGMSAFASFKRIVLPQAFMITLPNLCNFFIIQLKNTALAFTITVHDLMGLAEIEAGRSSKFLEAYLMAALMYWGVCMLFEFLFSLLEKKMKVFRKAYA